ncbi:hypothetical protein FH063_003990 [Azospirillum argentinense]|uniref:Uncharacterized protein n=1 Tax=Azospirillum argentinense TaxID=2970906 RepID=A0A5B0KLJ3_9PROT|nr:hypothetical protein FH063_003990 [Azospirillum argentinense]
MRASTAWGASDGTGSDRRRPRNRSARLIAMMVALPFLIRRPEFAAFVCCIRECRASAMAVQ